VGSQHRSVSKIENSNSSSSIPQNSIYEENRIVPLKLSQTSLGGEVVWSRLKIDVLTELIDISAE
jgi:hypothetical protein